MLIGREPDQRKPKERRAAHVEALGAADRTGTAGGDLAYQYGKAGTLAGIGLPAAQAVLESGGFGSAAQTLQPPGAITDGIPKLR